MYVLVKERERDNVCDSLCMCQYDVYLYGISSMLIVFGKVCVRKGIRVEVIVKNKYKTRQPPK